MNLESHTQFKPTLADAERSYRAELEKNPHSAKAWSALGISRFQQNDLEEAARCVAKAVLLEPGNAIFQRDLGELSRRLGHLDRALACALAATKLAPHDGNGFYNLALVYTDQKNDKNALKAYRRALKLAPSHGLAWNNLGSLLEQQGDLAGALKAYQRAVALNPAHIEAQNNLGALLIGMGQLDQAKLHLAAALEIRPDFAEAHYNLSSLKTYTRDDPHLAGLLSIVPNRAALSQSAQVQFSFALAKAFDDVGDYDAAFFAYAQGNDLQHRLTPYNEAHAEMMFQAVLKVFTREFIEAHQVSRTPAEQRTPIFIVGMPRSGTSLLEQILATHPSVYGAGELPDFDMVMQEVLATSADAPLGHAQIDEAQLADVGRSYIERVWRHSPSSIYITDKMPANFFHIGLIHLALPNARIIHAMRDPMDSCFSCFTRHFTKSMEFTYDLATVGRYYSRYARLMKHWHEVLPQGTILDLPYEAMIADTEREARRVTEFVGLPWDPACLDFHRNKRVVATASVAQVRKPIYSSSVGRWKHFAGHLQPLWAEVKDYRPHDDLAPEVMAALNQRPNKPPVVFHLVRSAEQWHAEGTELYRQGQHAQALECYDRALALRPQADALFNSKGFVLQELGRFDEALACLEVCVRLAPSNAIARLNLAMLQLRMGLWASGWDNYEARWTGSAEAVAGTINRALSPLPQWIGESETSTRRLLVITEQGFGDIFQFGRYLLLAAERFERVGFACSPPTLRLMEWSFGERIALFTRMPSDMHDWDLQCPLMSLPRAFATRPDTIPPAFPPYLKVSQPASAFWRDRLERNVNSALRVGIAWAGRKTHQYDARRSVAFEQLKPLFEDRRVGWVSLQKWAPEDLRPVIPEGVQWHDWTDELTDFADTAALIENLDLVISVDSSMVHLAGGLGRPVWMLNRFDSEWRWFHQRHDSPWYPTLRIFNQPVIGDWTSVIDRARDALKAHAPARQISKQSATEQAKRPSPSSPRVQLAAAPLSTANSDEKLDIGQTFDLAARLQGAGRLGDAEQLLRQILSVDPTNAHALHLLGVAAFNAGQAALATDFFKRAIESDPGVAMFHSNLTEILRQQGQFEAAVAAGLRAVELDPQLVTAHSNLGVAQYDAKQFEAAEASQKRALQLQPNFLPALNNLGSIERKRKNLPGAAHWYRRALAVQPDYLESLSNLGAVLCEDNRPEEAVPHLERALKLKPDYPEALCNLGLAHLESGRAAAALAVLQRALQIKPDHLEAMLALAAAMMEVDQRERAEQLLLHALALAPGSAAAHCQLGALLIQTSRGEQAETHFLRALELEPENTEALTGLGTLRLEQGDLEQSEQLYRQALAINPCDVMASFHLVQGQKVRDGDPVVEQLENMASSENLSPMKRVSLHYARGKVFDDLGRHHEAFEEYLRGASIKRGLIQYDAAAEAANCRRIAEIFDDAFMQRMQGAGNPSRKPIFVLGMPRSGTTLTEQIIASHSEVFGAGELATLLNVAGQMPAALAGASQLSQAHYPENLRAVTPAELTRWGGNYLEQLPEASRNFARLTDKMPANYHALGLIAAMLPNAKIIHVKRDPIDTCVSCFTRLFGYTQNGSYDLAEIGRQYVSYARLMEHWRALLPGRFLEVQYEDIVADMQAEAHKLINYCELPWEDSCLAFHKTKRSIRTASVLQVRQPIYTSSVQRWRRVEKYLAPLIEALGDYAHRR